LLVLLAGFTCSIYSNGGHVGPLAGSSDTFVKSRQGHTRTILIKIWFKLTVVSKENIFKRYF